MLQAALRSHQGRTRSSHAASSTASNLDALAAIGQQLNDESYLMLTEQRLDRSHDPGLTADLDLIADLEWLLRIQMAGRHDLLAAPKLIAKVDPSHSRSGR